MSHSNNESRCLDWIFSNVSNVHVAKDSGWFTEYTPFETYLPDTYGMTTQPLQVVGIGTVELPTEVSPDPSSPSPSPAPSPAPVLRLTTVLHAPSVLCNIIGMPIMDDHNVVLGQFENMKGYIADRNDRRLAYFDPDRRLFQPKLRNPPANGYHALREGGMYMINAKWSDSEREKWNDYRDDLRGGALSAEEKAWLKKHSGGEYHFLQTYGLSIYKDEDREEGRSILRALMRAEKS